MFSVTGLLRLFTKAIALFYFAIYIELNIPYHDEGY